MPWLNPPIDKGASSSAVCGTQNSESWIRNGPGVMSFSNLVRESSGHLVLPIDSGNKDDVPLLGHLSRALTTFVKRTERSAQRFTGNRIDDVGKRFELAVAEELRRTPLEAAVLGGPGCPDCALEQGERATYLEIKTSAAVHKGANRCLKKFAFSSGKKIKPDARHLLLKVQLEEEDNKIWKVVAWELRDLSTLKTRLKTEFDAGFGDLDDVGLRGSSDGAAQPLTVGGRPSLDEPMVATSRARRRRRPGAGRTHLFG